MKEFTEKILGKRDGSYRHGKALGRLNRLELFLKGRDVKGIPPHLFIEGGLFILKKIKRGKASYWCFRASGESYKKIKSVNVIKDTYGAVTLLITKSL